MISAALRDLIKDTWSERSATPFGRYFLRGTSPKDQLSYLKLNLGLSEFYQPTNATTRDWRPPVLPDDNRGFRLVTTLTHDG